MSGKLQQVEEKIVQNNLNSLYVWEGYTQHNSGLTNEWINDSKTPNTGLTFDTAVVCVLLLVYRAFVLRHNYVINLHLSLYIALVFVFFWFNQSSHTQQFYRKPHIHTYSKVKQQLQ